jgi:ubiquinone/menaquinone biosynthesis C-methylase UbiE
MERDFVKEYWEGQALSYEGSHWASWGDHFMIDLEIENIGHHIHDNDSVLDVGCANGYSTLHQYQKHKLKSIVGLDFAENMVKEANNSKAKLSLGNEVSFEVGDIKKLRFENDTFDVVYTTRVLINLLTWPQQIEGIEECVRVTKEGGVTIFSEGFWEPLVLLNSLRALKQLAPLVEHDFNRYLKKQKLEDYLNSKAYKYEVKDFSSVYYLGSRFIRDLVTDIAAYPGFTNPINKIFYELEEAYSGGGFGIQQAYIIHK